jgi:hypothetical protein
MGGSMHCGSVVIVNAGRALDIYNDNCTTKHVANPWAAWMCITRQWAPHIPVHNHTSAVATSRGRLPPGERPASTPQGPSGNDWVSP